MSDRDCENCKHHKLLNEEYGTYSCEKWHCHFESKFESEEDKVPNTAEWVEVMRPMNNPPWYFCSHCDRETDEKTPFCPMCGRKMVNYETVPPLTIDPLNFEDDDGRESGLLAEF